MTMNALPQSAASIWILGDQLLSNHPALAGHPPGQLRVVMVENEARFARHPYHKKKQVLLKSAMRHYAERLRGQGYWVDYRRAPTLAAGLGAHIAEFQPNRLVAMAASEYAGRGWQRQRMASALGVAVDVLPNTQFLVGQFDPHPQAGSEKRVVMETFYRHMRQHFGVLMDGAQPAGGAWNYDADNRKRLPKGVSAPPPPQFEPDAITQQAIDEVASGPGFGRVEGFSLAVTHEQAAAALDDFIARRLAQFGAYEDAMTTRDGVLFHSVLSPYLNIGLLEPMQVVRAAEAAYTAGGVPINSAEGLIRQVLGWREFMYWQYWRQMPAMAEANAWEAEAPLPAFFWTGDTPMNCLSHVLHRAIDDGYAHHIERLMLLTNFAMLAGLNPQAVNAWFLSAFIDAYDWVMIPNVLGMGLNADGGKTATKPYIASANYIKTMSDYCGGCPFDPAKRVGEGACPFNVLYWNFLLTHEARLRANPRLGPAVLGLRHLDEAERQQVRDEAAVLLRGLAASDVG